MSEAPAAPPVVDPAAPAAPPAAPAAPAWHGYTNPEDVAYVDNKAWKSPADVVSSYRNAEKLIGRNPADLLTLPRADDPAGFRAVMQKLGLPEAADKYDFGTPAAGGPAFDESYLTWAKTAFHEVGLPANMAKELVAKNNAYVQGVLADQEKTYQAQLTLDKQSLLKEWGGGHERMMNAASSAAKALGLDGAVLDAIEKNKGYAETMKLFASIGQKLGEGNFVSADGAPKFDGNLTPAEAKVQWDQAVLDPAFKAALFDSQHPGHKAAKAKQLTLMKIMHPEG